MISTMSVPLVSPQQFSNFFSEVEEHFTPGEWLHFSGSLIDPQTLELDNWVFCLVNDHRSSYLFIPTEIALFFIDLAFSNLSPLPNVYSTESCPVEYLQHLHQSHHFEQKPYQVLTYKQFAEYRLDRSA